MSGFLAWAGTRCGEKSYAVCNFRKLQRRAGQLDDENPHMATRVTRAYSCWTMAIRLFIVPFLIGTENILVMDEGCSS
jgi:hypothetical protein